MQTLTSSALEAHSASGTERLIVALDCPTVAQSRELVAALGPAVAFYKVGWRTFLAGGLGFVDELRSRGKRVFLDLKIDDIAETVSTAVAELRDRADLLTLMGTPATVRAAVQGRGDAANPKLLSVTFLSSLDETDFRAMLPEGTFAPAEAEALPAFIRHRAVQAIEAGADGLIASGGSVTQIRDAIGWSPLVVTPGIRPAGAASNDQKRTRTPAEAIAEGSDLIVVGRPVWASSNPVAAAQAIIADIDAGWLRRTHG